MKTATEILARAQAEYAKTTLQIRHLEDMLRDILEGPRKPSTIATKRIAKIRDAQAVASLRSEKHFRVRKRSRG